MKKEYTKPVIMFESFALSTSIAGDCEKKTHTPAAFTCAYPVEVFGRVWNVFMSGIGACTTTEDVVTDEYGDAKYIKNDVCYHVFDGGRNNVFNS
jgi:hypothetical protein